ncbi:hypothetical protein CA13_33600 [Planctomycetes bacterium CA13]|uniref:BBP7 family outer membrane beta-barrel protein n=1 Tax=Novipirellula herctigrandis TaxID=2527986 RepID=A0A5C5Z3X2_9BACT|nr:hypothetical protein CA13_33600 [Planctomycetes bacterium CA13]
MRLPRAHDAQTTLWLALLAMFASVTINILPANGQVRTKKPDRGVYQPPMVTPSKRTKSTEDFLVDASVTEASGVNAIEGLPQDEEVQLLRREASIKQVGHSEDALQSWPMPAQYLPSDGNVIYHDAYQSNVIDGEYTEGEYYESDSIHEPNCGCDSCDSYGCDSYGQCGPGSWTNARLGFTPDRWFGSIELLLMFRSGDTLPPLLTTGPTTSPNPGQIGAAGTSVLVGNSSVLNEMTAGGRLQLGTWLDDCHLRSMVFRGWLTGDETFNFETDQSRTPVITRPFFNVTTGEAASQDTQVIATPDFTTVGVATVHAANEVHGADISIRQQAYSRFGGTVDVLYGYQYMRMNDSLRTFSTSTAGASNALPLGSVISITDSFEAENEFHGGQLGFASRYREGCWSFRSLWKVAFGQLTRRSALSGRTEISNVTTVVDPNGLLVRSTNDGTETDHTFGWVPELDLSLGWHQFPQFDVTVGYHIIAMTDAVQVSGLIDPQLASNLADPVDDPLRPSRQLSDKTFYVHGIHFGLEYVF